MADRRARSDRTHFKLVGMVTRTARLFDTLRQVAEDFEAMLTGGHRNSLGKTVEVVDIVLADRTRLADLYDCYFSDDAVVRLRVSSAMKRVAAERPRWIIDLMDRLQSDVADARLTLGRACRPEFGRVTTGLPR